MLEANTPTYPFETCSFLWGERNYLLRQPVQIVSAFQDGLWVFECYAYGLSAFSSDRDEAFAHLREEFSFLYEGLVNEPDAALTRDAALLRDRLRADVQQAQALA